MQTSVMIIEDNGPTLKLMAEQLRGAGFGVLTAENGRDALNLLKMARPDVIIVDLQMHPVGGLDFARGLIDSRYEFPVIMVTGDPSTDILYQASKVGISQVLKKPVPAEMLIKAVDRALRK